eukprot:g4793.t1
MAETLAHLSLGAPVEKPLVKTSVDWDLHRPAQSIDSKDIDTPDGWIPRNPSILRLTGRHPLNCEPPMSELHDAGFVTPVSLHLVRNHGAVPKIEWSAHRVEVTGLVDRPLSLTMDEIVKLPAVTIPVTVTCAGNRRKEENMTKKSIGFNWGPTATSCSYWTGVRLCDVLRHVGAKGPTEGANFVCFRGPKGELPKGDDGSYGTSISLSHAMDPSNEVLIAYKQNGRWLTPDHGFPVRMIIPGFIGGRMVKWLSEITVTKEESRNFYHYHDNRVLPPHVDEKLAKEEGWWFKPEYIINELNINSAVARPWHDELVSLKENKPYTLRGYAYTGGGRKVIRVEVSTNGGTHWHQASIKRMENSDNAYGKCWSWVFWTLDLEVFDFLTSEEIVVRAVDSAQNLQPDKLTWNVMGMMNNCQFRIKVHKATLVNGEMALRFQHPAPTEIGAHGNVGWREPTSKVAPMKTYPAIRPTPEPMKESIPNKEREIALNPKKKISFALSERIELSHNVRLFRFALQSPEHRLGLPVGQHMFMYATINGAPCMRAYTPTSSDDEIGHFDLVVKIYRANEHPKFPDGGKMSQFMDAMKIGDTLDVKGPIGHFTYTGLGNYIKNRKPGKSSKLSMIAGGTGITPMYQVIKAILKDPNDQTEIKLLYANQTEDDILLRQELESLADKHANFSLWYTLDRPPQKWGYSTGFINKEMLELALIPPTDDGLVLMCGPKPMIDYACKPNLEELGWEKHQMVEF